MGSQIKSIEGLAVSCGLSGAALLVFREWGGGWTAFALLMLAIGLLGVAQGLKRLDQRMSELEKTRSSQQ